VQPQAMIPARVGELCEGEFTPERVSISVWTCEMASARRAAEVMSRSGRVGSAVGGWLAPAGHGEL
jgi:hypothetical protein